MVPTITYIALAILCVSGQLRQQEVDGAIYASELGLSGELRPIKGVINITETAKNNRYRRIYVPADNAVQASLV